MIVQPNTYVMQVPVAITSVNLGERLRQEREALGLSQGEVARRARVSQGTVANVEGGHRKNPRELLALAEAVNVTPEYLKSGKMPKRPGSNVQAAQSVKRLPIISWVQAGQLEDVQESGPVSDWATLFDPDRTVGDQAFALRVSGDSMTSPVPGGSPSFPDGTILIVDPDAGYDPGDFVIAKDEETQQATFKRLTLDGGRWYLKPLNPAYPTREIDQQSLRVIGKVVEFQIRGRL